MYVGERRESRPYGKGANITNVNDDETDRDRYCLSHHPR